MPYNLQQVSIVHPKIQKKIQDSPNISNLVAHAWSTKYRRKQKLIAQFVIYEMNLLRLVSL